MLLWRSELDSNTQLQLNISWCWLLFTDIKGKTSSNRDYTVASHAHFLVVVKDCIKRTRYSAFIFPEVSVEIRDCSRDTCAMRT